MNRGLLLSRLLTDRTIKTAVMVWIVMALFILFKFPVEDNVGFYYNSNNVTRVQVSALSGTIMENRSIAVDIELLLWYPERGINKAPDADSVKSIAEGTIASISSLPLSARGFKNIVRSDLSHNLKRYGILGRKDHFLVNVSLR